MLFVFVQENWCATRLPYQMMCVSFISNAAGFTSGAGTAYHSSAPESRGLVFCVICYRSQFFCPLFVRPLYCMFSDSPFYSLLWNVQTFLTYGMNTEGNDHCFHYQLISFRVFCPCIPLYYIPCTSTPFLLFHQITICPSIKL